MTDVANVSPGARGTSAEGSRCERPEEVSTEGFDAVLHSMLVAQDAPAGSGEAAGATDVQAPQEVGTETDAGADPGGEASSTVEADAGNSGGAQSAPSAGEGDQAEPGARGEALTEVAAGAVGDGQTQADGLPAAEGAGSTSGAQVDAVEAAGEQPGGAEGAPDIPDRGSAQAAETGAVDAPAEEEGGRTADPEEVRSGSQTREAGRSGGEKPGPVAKPAAEAVPEGTSVAGDPQSAAGAEAAQPGQVGPETPVEVGVQRADGTAEPGNAQEPQGTAGTARPEEAAPQREAVLRQVVRAARLNVAEGSTRFELRLDPPSLGKVGVVLDLREGALSVSFKVESDAVRELLQNSMAQLRSSLSSHGVSVAGLDVEGSGSEAVEQQGAQGWSGFDRGAGASGGEEAEGVAGQEPAATGRDRVREGSIEYWA